MVSTVGIDEVRVGSSDQAKLIDVRSAAEFAIGHIPGAINVPMEQVDARTEDIGEGPVVIVCEAGTRAAIVARWLADRQPVSVLSGGTAAWRKAGLPLVTCAPSRWSLERQVRFTAGLIVLIATLLSVLFHPGWVYMAMFVGAGLPFAGATNLCGMAILLARMPWNRELTTKASNVTQVSAPCRR
jgi:rhodanese-related sulfurtransferase